MLNNKFMRTLMDILDESNLYMVLAMIYMALFVSGSVSVIVNMVLFALLSLHFVVNLFFSRSR
ncbi:hypothetical protein EJP77_14645 [Paenibacillus zeisoli]|uniref:Uncharacterized protein n=1 Tax=Paenibacillus zeisoli TaxID=2496267 RepID=A0A3S1B4F6_9BACL|nr:hypothetical protein [Paenibacillus zeisoli]RUT29610.1 hypothetical protein EJP77_14645 [Paenibacillus zeisoli]